MYRPRVPDPDLILERTAAHKGNLFAVASELNGMTFTRADGSRWTAAALEAELAWRPNWGDRREKGVWL